MGWLDDIGRAAVNPIGEATRRLTGNQQLATIANPTGRVMENVAGVGPKSRTVQSPYLTSSQSLNSALDAGRTRGQDIFYNDPDMQELRTRRQDLSQGFDGAELGALREDARNQIQGQRSQYLKQLQGNVGRGGIGGARAAAMKINADQGFAKNRADMERKLVTDNAALKRTGLNDLQDYYFRQKLGSLGTEMGYGQLASAENSANAARAAANQKEQKGIVGELFSGLF